MDRELVVELEGMLYADMVGVVEEMDMAVEVEQEDMADGLAEVVEDK